MRLLIALVLFTLARSQSPRAAIEQQYERMAQAIYRKDIAAILALTDSSFTSKNPGGIEFDYNSFVAYQRRFAETVDTVLYTHNTIRSFRASGDTAVADVCQEFRRLQRLRDSTLHRVETSALQEETWIRRVPGGAWRRSHVENVRGMRWFIDGVRINPNAPFAPGAPPFQPDPDPPTGCGK